MTTECEIIQFSTARLSAKRVEKIGASARAIIASVHQEPKRPLPEPLTETCRNHRLRQSRRDAWWAARHLTEYWRARLDWQTALSIAQEYNVADSHKFPSAKGEDRTGLLDLWRAALVKQMLTPAPDVAAVNWKRAAFAQGQYRYVGVKAERLERAIDADVEWLKSHPSRKSIAASRQAAMARRREFKEAMRQRIRDVAASRDLSDEEIKPALTLKHREIDRFVEKHGVNFEWLLEGKGRIFEKDPITLGPNMSSAELAALVRTLPEAQQQKFEATVDRLLAEQAAVEPEPAHEPPPPVA